MTIGVLVRSDESVQDPTPIVLRRLTRFGRTSTSDVFLHGHSVSRDHAIIERRPEGYALLDHNSRNGTRVNGVAVTRRFLHDGDHVAFGDERFVFHEIEEDAIREAVEPQALPSSEPTDAAPETRPIPEFDGHVPNDWRILNAWQVVREFKMCAKSSLENVLRHIANELVGTYGVKKALVFLSASRAAGAPRWIRAGSDGVAIGEKMREEKIRSVADTGVSLSLCGGRCASGLADTGLEAVCVPINVGDSPAGCLYVEAEEFLPAGFSTAAKAVAEAVSIGLSIKAGPMAEDAGGNVHAPRRETVPIIGRSSGLQQVVRLARKAAATDSIVLIRGETGTGKEVIAEFIVAESRRGDGPFVKVHCSAVPETLLESALFGHEKGAFTGAVGQKKGYFEVADGGTIFLDEIGEWSLEMQVKLLRVLQEKEFMRVGGNKTIRVDVRIIAATNRDLAQRIREGKFREDLFYRLNVVALHVPPLRERREDIPELIGYFIEEIGGAIATRIKGIAPEAVSALERYDWPGNIRELRNVIERSLALAEGDVITVDDLPPEVALASDSPTPAVADAKGVDLVSLELRHIQRVLRECGGNKRLAAQRLGISRSTLYEKLRSVAL